jgi:putative flippase GtrA
MSTPIERGSGLQSIAPPGGQRRETLAGDGVIARLRRSHLVGQLVRFGLVGVINTVLDFGLLFILRLELHLPLLLANTISVSVGIVNSFFWNKYFTFKAKGSDRWRSEAAAFVAVSLTGLLVNNIGIYVFHSLLGTSSAQTLFISKAGASILSLTWNFLGYRFLAFRQRPVGGLD